MVNYKPIYVTRPYLPPLEELLPSLENIWKTRVLTNIGPYHQLLEKKLAKQLKVPYICLFNNATTALLVALKALKITGDVITTPFSFIATSNVLLWNNINPIFVDIELGSLNIDAKLINEKITKRTSAIMPVHCYGNPCDVMAIEEIANRYNLKVIHDASHAFGVEAVGKGVMSFGDISVISFHATKIFNTFEGGAIAVNSLELKNKIDLLKNFGIENESSINGEGINGKLNEFSSVLGLTQLNHISELIDQRKSISKRYIKELSNIKGIRFQEIKDSIKYNYSYFPIIIENEYKLNRNELYDLFQKNKIFLRKYFYPLISNTPKYRHMQSSRLDQLPIANRIAEQVLCLPIYPELSLTDQNRVINILKEASR